MKRILVISFYYPPYIGVGANRVLRFKRYLKKADRDVFVLTPFRGEIPDAEAGYVRLPAAIRRLSSISLSKSDGAEHKVHAQSLSSKVLKCISIPDRQVYWLPFGIRKALGVIRKKKIQLIYTTSPPESSHIMGLLLSMLTNIPWIAEFRDTWVYDSLNPWIEKFTLRFFVDSFLEKTVIKTANGIVVNTPVAQQYFQTHYLTEDPERIVTIHTGFDHLDFARLKDDTHAEKFRIVHTGSLGLSRNTRRIEPFLKGIKQAIQKAPRIKKETEILFIGKLSADEKNQVHENHLDDIIKIIPPVPYKQVLRYQLGADLLLCIGHMSDVRTADIPGKIFEYIGANKPILALAGHGATADIVKRFNGLLAPPTDPVTIGNRILEAYTKYHNNTLKFHTNPNLRKEFTTEYSVRKLINFMNKISKLSRLR